MAISLRHMGLHKSYPTPNTNPGIHRILSLPMGNSSSTNYNLTLSGHSQALKAHQQPLNTAHGDGYGKLHQAPIPSTGPHLATGVWIAYMKETNTTGTDKTR